MRPYYEADGITIYHGDCRDVLPEIARQSVDLLLTDPPYGMQFAGQSASTAQANIRADGVRQGVRVVRQAMLDLSPAMRSDAHVLMFCHWESWPDFYDALSAYVSIRNALVWWKDRGGMGDCEMEYHRDYEIILYGAHGRRPAFVAGDRGAKKRTGAVIAGYAPVGADRVHPTEKPIDLLQLLIQRHAPERGMVLDPFCGSGTTLLAARNMGRRALGIEVEERFCQMAAERLTQGVLDLGGAA